MASEEQSNAMCLKRKFVDDCLAKSCKASRTSTENGHSCGSSAHHCHCCSVQPDLANDCVNYLKGPSARGCHCCCMQPNLANDCVNYLKSGVPSRIMFYKQGSWCNFPEQITKSLVEGFRGDKSSVVIVMDDQPLLVDFLSMTMVNLKTRKQRSVAWFDDTGKRFFPSIFFDEEADGWTKLDSSIVDGSIQGIMWDKVINSPPEVVKQVVIESSPPVSQNPSAADILRKKITSVERGSESFLFVQSLFLSGMGPFATPNNVLHIHRYSPNDITAQCRLEAFERQVRSTREERGDANVRYGWLGSRKQDIVRILINGFGNTGKPVERAGLKAGIYLSPEDRAFTSVGLCDVDEKGVQYMLLCRAILGNMEAIKPGSEEYFPSSQVYDSGVDDCTNPKCYVMWPSHLSTHIRLEYLISFKLDPKVQEYLLGLKGLWFHPSPKEAMLDASTVQPIKCKSGKGPTSPWISFRDLFAIIQDKISPVARELLFHHYEELKEKKITREEMVKKMIIIVGEKLLADVLKELHHTPSVWYKSPVEVKFNDPATTTSEPTCLDVPTNSNCAAATLSTKSVALIVPPENSASFSAKGFDARSPSMARASDHSLLTGAAQENFASFSAKGGDSVALNVSPQVQNSPIASTKPESSASLNTNGCNSFAPSMAAVVRDSLVNAVSKNSLPLSVKSCNSLQQSVAAKSRDSLSLKFSSERREFPSFVHEGCDSLMPILVLGSSASLSAKGFNSSAPQSSTYLVMKDHDAPGSTMTPQNSACVIKKDHTAFAPSMAPHGCDSSRPSVARENSSTPKGLSLAMATKGTDCSAECIAAKCDISPAPNMAPNSLDAPILTVVPQGRDSGGPSMAPGKSAFSTSQGCDSSMRMAPKSSVSPASIMVLKGRDSPVPIVAPKDDPDSPVATMVPKMRNSLTPMNGVSKDPTAQCGAQNRIPRPSFDTKSSIARAADTLVALSTLREKGS